MTSIKVAIKVRPLIKRELDENLPVQWHVSDNLIYSIDPETRKRNDNGFVFDHIFGMETNNRQVFDIVAKPIIEAAVNGINGTIFAYGQTGSGKTYTMMGDENVPGILTLSVEHIFECIKKTTGREFLLRVSYFEIYNERINDLIDKNGVDLKIREENGEVVIKCKEEVSTSPDNIFATMKKGDKNRRIGKTDMNEYSSRSHTIFRITIESRETSSDSDGAIQVSQLNLVDLAGSERASATGATGERFKEGKHINLSLSALGLVIKQLSESQENQKFINFRDSKLTRMLQASLGGNAMTTIICAVTPAAFEETNCTLAFASRAKTIKNKPEINEVTSDSVLLKRYKKQIDKLKKDLQKATEKNHSEEVKELESKLEDTDRMNKVLKERIELLQMNILSADSTCREDKFKIRSKRRRTWAPGSSFASPWPRTPELPTIMEKSPDKPQDRRKSQIQDVDICNDSFSTPYTDFEVELIKAQQNCNIDDDELSTVTKRNITVSFNEQIDVVSYENFENRMSHGSASPGTPKSVLRERLKYYTDEYTTLQEYTTLEKQLLSNDYNVELRNENRRLSEELTNVENRRISLEKENSMLQETLQKKEEKINLLTADRNEFEHMSMELQKQLTQKIMELESRDIVKYENDIRTLENYVTSLEGFSNSLKEENESLKDKLKTAQHQINDLNNMKMEMSTLQMESTKNFDDEKNQLYRELDELRAKVKNDKSKINMDQEMCDWKRELENTVLKLEEDKRHLCREVNRLKEAADGKISVSEVEELQQDLQTLKANIAELQANLQDRNNVVLRLEEEKRNLLKELKELQEVKEEEKHDTEKEELQKHLESLNSDFTKLQKQFQERENMMLKLEEEKHNLLTQLNNLKEAKEIEEKHDVEKDELKQRMESLSSSLAELQERFQERENMVMKLEEEKNKLLTQMDNLKKEEAEDEYDIEKEELKQRLESMNLNLVKLEKQYLERENVVLKLEEEKDNLLIQLDNLEKMKETEKEGDLEKEELKQYLETLKLNLAEVQEKFEEHKSKVLILEEENRKLLIELHEFQKSVETQDDHNKSLKTFKTELEDMQLSFDECESTILKLKEVKQNLFLELDELKETEEAEEKRDFEKEELKQHLKSLEINLVELQEQLQARENEIMHLEDDKCNLLTELEKLKNGREADEKRDVENNKHEQHSETLKDKLIEVQEKLQERENRVQELISEKHILTEKLNALIKDKEIGESESPNEMLRRKVEEYEVAIHHLEAEKLALNEKLSDMKENINLKFHCSTESIEKFEQSEGSLHLTVLEESLKDAEHMSDEMKGYKNSSEIRTTEQVHNHKDCNRTELELIERLEKQEKETSNLKEMIEEYKEKIKKLEMEKYSLIEKLGNLAIGRNNEKEFACRDIEHSPVIWKLPKDNLQKSTPQSLDSSSIFVNESYFDKMMETSCTQSSIDGENMLSTLSTMSASMTSTCDLSGTNLELEDLSSESNFTLAQKWHLQKVKLENDNAKLAIDLQRKIQESKEVTKAIKELKQDVQKLEQTIYDLTSENTDLCNKLTEERERIKELEKTCQDTNGELHERLSSLMNENSQLQLEVANLNEQLDDLRLMNPTVGDNEIQQELLEYKKQVLALTTENEELSSNLIDKIEELDKVKQSKSLLYDHECIFKEKTEELSQEMDSLRAENDALSTQLMEKIEENEMLRNDVDVLSKKLDVLATCEKDEKDFGKVKEENSRMKSEIVEMRVRLDQLSKENEAFSSNLMETMDELEKTRGNMSIAETSALDISGQSGSEDVKTLQDKVKRLTLLNQKLSDLKLGSCARCMQMRDSSESRRSLKLEAQTLNHKLKDLQIKFERKCAETEVLRSKAKEDLNVSLLNGSITESLNVSVIEEKVQHLNTKLEMLKENHDKLTDLYQEKCSELEKLHDISVTESQTMDLSHSKSKNKIDKLRDDLDVLSEDIKTMGSNHAHIRKTLDKFLDEKTNMQKEIDILRNTNEQLSDKVTVAEGKVAVLDSEMSSLCKQIDRLQATEKELQSEKVTLEVDLEDIKMEKKKLADLVVSLQQSVEQMNMVESSLRKELEDDKEEKEELIARQNLAEVTIQKYKDQLEESKEKLEKINALLNEQLAENANLKDEITKLQAIIKTEKENSKNCDDLSAKEELEAARSCIMNEIKSLNPSINCSDKTVSELFVSIVQTIMQKEREIVKKLEENFNRAKRKLSDEIQQHIDAEKRANQWAKTLEVDIEKLQADLTEQEAKYKEKVSIIEKLESEMKEISHENLMLREKMTTLESDFSALQLEIEKYSNSGMNPSEALNAAQEKERQAREMVQSKEEETQKRLKADKEFYNQQIEELSNAVETYKSKNNELRHNMEAYEANELQLKNIIDLKATELGISNQKITELKIQIEQLSDAYSHLNAENVEKDKRIEEVTTLLKTKCDMVSEYKTKLETIKPENDYLQTQLKEKKTSIDKYKQDIDLLKLESKKLADTMKDRLLAEEVKYSALNKQLSEVNNKNAAVMNELERLQEKYEELKEENEKLIRKVRNSTSKVRAEEEMRNLEDENRTLRINLDGATNRITELQENKANLMKELAEIRVKHESIQRDFKDLENTLNSYKARHPSAAELSDTCDELLQEKNRLILECEEKTLLLKQRDEKLIKLQDEVDSLTIKNQELNEEMDDMVKHIRSLEIDNGELMLKVQEMEISQDSTTGNAHLTEIKDLKSKLQKSEDNLREYKLKVHELQKEMIKSINQLKIANQKVNTLNKEKDELQAKISSLEEKMECLSNNSSRSKSPAFEVSLRKQRRSNQFNQKRQLEQVCECATSCVNSDCVCAGLRKQIHELELEIVTKNAKISTLELQIQSENFPYQKKCRELKEELLAYQNKNLELQSSVQKLQRDIFNTNSRECEICRKWKLNKRDQSTQSDKIVCLSGVSSGIIEEHERMKKLEKEKSMLRELCRSRIRIIRTLEEKLNQYKEKFDCSIVTIQD